MKGGGGDDMPGDNMSGIANQSLDAHVSNPVITLPPTNAPDNTEEAESTGSPNNVNTSVIPTSANEGALELAGPSSKKARKNKKLME